MFMSKPKTDESNSPLSHNSNKTVLFNCNSFIFIKIIFDKLTFKKKNDG